jgi:uncharacterized damage-inducible protein DinB
MDPGVRFSELLAYNAEETASWKQFFQDHPAALDLPCDIAGAGSVRKLLQHVFLSELFFANLVTRAQDISLENVPSATLDELFEIHASAQRKFEEALEQATPEQWEETVPLGFRDLKATRRKMLVQAMLHGVNHRAQLATFLRQQGFKQDWTHDLIVSPAMK